MFFLVFIAGAACAANISSENYSTTIYITTGANTSSSNYKTLLSLDTGTNLSSANYRTYVGTLYAFPAIITKSRNRWNISDSNITVNSNSTGFMEILTNNTDPAFSYNSVLVNVSIGSLIPSGYALNDSETYTINLANGTFNLRNVTIKTSSPYVIEKDAAAADCVGYAFYSKYCIKQTITDLGSGQTKREYWIKSFINNTNNITKSYKIFYQMPVSRFADWPYRDAGSVTYTAGSSSTNLSLSSDGSYVTLLVDTSHGNSSLAQGDYAVEIYYSRTTTVGLSPGGGGGGGGGEPYLTIQIITIKAGNWTQNPSLIQKLGKSGDIFTESIVLGNPNPYNITVKLFFQQLENDPSWKWAKFINGNFRLTEKEITLMPGSYTSPYRKEVEFEVIVPQEVGEYLYQFNIISSDLNNSGYQATRFSVDSRPAFSFFQSIVSFAEGGIHFPKPIAGVSYIPTTWLLLGFMVLVLIGILYRIYKKN